jgi:hypothetical protein
MRAVVVDSLCAEYGERSTTFSNRNVMIHCYHTLLILHLTDEWDVPFPSSFGGETNVEWLATFQYDLGAAWIQPLKATQLWQHLKDCKWAIILSYLLNSNERNRTAFAHHLYCESLNLLNSLKRVKNPSRSGS